MKKLIVMVLIIASFLNLTLCKTYSLTLDDNGYKNNIKRDLLVLMLAYEDEIEDVEVSQDSFVYLILKNGKKVLYDDKKEKGKEEKISNADIQDTLEIIYPLNSIDSVLDNIDPGRGRSYSFLNAIYGSNRNEIEKNLSNFSISVPDTFLSITFVSFPVMALYFSMSSLNFNVCHWLLKAAFQSFIAARPETFHPLL